MAASAALVLLDVLLEVLLEVLLDVLLEVLLDVLLEVLLEVLRISDMRGAARGQGKGARGNPSPEGRVQEGAGRRRVRVGHEAAGARAR